MGVSQLHVQKLSKCYRMHVKRLTHGSWILALPTSLHTYLHMLAPHASFGGTPSHRSPFLGETLDRWIRAVYPIDRLRKGVDQCTFLLVYVWLGNSNMGKQAWTPNSKRFPPVDPRWEFRCYTSKNFLSVIACM
jgi:hypothetical protein